MNNVGKELRDQSTLGQVGPPLARHEVVEKPGEGEGGLAVIVPVRAFHSHFQFEYLRGTSQEASKG